MGQLILCWATVVLWVRVALNLECQIGEEEVLMWCSFCVVEKDISGKTDRQEFFTK